MRYLESTGHFFTFDGLLPFSSELLDMTEFLSADTLSNLVRELEYAIGTDFAAAQEHIDCIKCRLQYCKSTECTPSLEQFKRVSCNHHIMCPINQRNHA